MTDVRSSMEMHRRAREHVDNNVLLNIAAFVQNYLPPISSENSTGSYEAICSNGNMPDDCGHGVHIACCINDGHHAFE
jgi:hypothetical protein